MRSDSDERREHVGGSTHGRESRTRRDAWARAQNGRSMVDAARPVPVSVEPRTQLWTHATPLVALGDARWRECAQAAMAALFGAPDTRRFAVRYWDGTIEQPIADDAPPPAFTLVIPSAGALRRAFLTPSELHLGEAYVRGDIEVDGNMEAAVELGDTLRTRVASPRTAVHAVRALLALPRDHSPEQAHERRPGLSHIGWRHSRRRDRAAVRSHYDVGNDFYSLWLDRDMVYSCAYFVTGAEDIDAAQHAKLDLLCRKLRLVPGERLLDIGCGWGGLIRHAARNYGVEAVGITLSERQASLARQRIRADGLEGRCRVEVRDYRDLADGTAFDKVVSVGMFEHVGRSKQPEYFRTAARLTKPGGLFLNHGIVRAENAGGMLAVAKRALWRQGAFIQRYVFPDGELVPLETAVRCGERAGLEARDVESLREHYALTLRHWVRRLEHARDAAVALVGDQTYRVWRLYMSASAHAFASGRIGLAQVLFAKPDARGRVALPRTRADIYAPRTAALRVVPRAPRPA
ncbi:MAG TPA: cyclopropane-fatty-acyl-phospholipid synthase family protein [Gemmatimonadaceae bacterium]